MLENFRLFLKYKEQNKNNSKALGIRRDKKIELYFLLGLYKKERFSKILKRNCKCYIDYYEERNKEIRWKDLNYIICRIVSIFNILGDFKILEKEKNNFDNYFVKIYVENKISELIKHDALETKIRAVK